MNQPVIDPHHIQSTEALIRPHIRRTPIIHVAGSDFDLPDVHLTFKLELMQHAGSFKARGAFAHLLRRNVPAAGIVAASGGNHGVAVAYAANQLGVTANIFVPSVSSPSKMQRIKDQQAQLHIAGERYDDALNASESFIDRTGAVAVHAFDQTETLLGQGTTALEFEQQCNDLDTLLVSVGGGGFIGGIAAWFNGRVKVIGVEPELAPTLHDALAAGEPVDAPAGGIAADSLAPRQVGQLMFPIAQRAVERVVLVTDRAIIAAQHRLWNTLRVAAEPGAAATVAALLSGAYQPQAGERVGIIICGGDGGAVSFREDTD